MTRGGEAQFDCALEPPVRKLTCVFHSNGVYRLRRTNRRTNPHDSRLRYESDRGCATSGINWSETDRALCLHIYRDYGYRLRPFRYRFVLLLFDRDRQWSRTCMAESLNAFWNVLVRLENLFTVNRNFISAVSHSIPPHDDDDNRIIILPNRFRPKLGGGWESIAASVHRVMIITSPPPPSTLGWYTKHEKSANNMNYGVDVRLPTEGDPC